MGLWGSRRRLKPRTFRQTGVRPKNRPYWPPYLLFPRCIHESNKLECEPPRWFQKNRPHTRFIQANVDQAVTYLSTDGAQCSLTLPLQPEGKQWQKKVKKIEQLENDWLSVLTVVERERETERGGGESGADRERGEDGKSRTNNKLGRLRR